jgi:hypothetical protein
VIAARASHHVIAIIRYQLHGTDKPQFAFHPNRPRRGFAGRDQPRLNNDDNYSCGNHRCSDRFAPRSLSCGATIGARGQCSRDHIAFLVNAVTGSAATVVLQRDPTKLNPIIF